MNFLLVQIKATYQLARTGREVDLWIFFIDGQNQVLPMIVARILGRPVLLLFAYSAVETLRLTNPVLALGASLFSSANCTLCDRIGVTSATLVEAWSLSRWRSKIRVAHEHFISLTEYPPGDCIETRERVVGFVGRLNPEKGAMEFLKAVAILHAHDPGLRFRIIGDGLLRGEMEAYIQHHRLEGCVQMLGWIPHTDVRGHLTRLRLLVVPSYTESGPMIAYEAMGGATPLLITKGGLVAGLIDDGVNGYLLDTPTPAAIAAEVERVLGDPALGAVAQAGRRLVEQNLSFERTCRRLEDVIWELLGGGGRIRLIAGQEELARSGDPEASNVA